MIHDILLFCYITLFYAIIAACHADADYAARFRQMAAMMLLLRLSLRC